MPIPKPGKKEDKEKFMSRCMGDPVMLKEYPDQKQRAAICMSRHSEEKKEMDEKPEVRAVSCYESAPRWEIRQEKDGPPKIVGYSAVFNSWSKDLGGFTEQISPGAFGNALKSSDVRALLNHDKNYVLGRQSAGTLRMIEDDKGLLTEIDPPDTQWARDLMVSIRRGDISDQSFGFRVKTDEWRDEQGKTTRTIKEFEQLFDVSVVTFPAYPETTVAVRSMEAWHELHKPEPEVNTAGVLRKRLGLKTKLINMEKE